MQRFYRTLFPVLVLCFLLVMGGYYMGRRSKEGLILTTQRTPESTQSTENRSIPAADTQTAAKEVGKLDLNQATLEELIKLPGIGEARAKRILEYRTEFGPFRQASDLMNVNGIGEAIFSGLRDLVYVEESHENFDH